MSTKFTFQDRILSISSPVSIDVVFDYIIYQAVLKDDMIIVVLLNSDTYRNIQNVYGVDSNGNIVWQIEQPRSKTAFVNLYFTKSNHLVAGNCAAFEYHLDARTGKVLHIEVSK